MASPFILHSSSFIFHPSSFILHLSSFIFHPSSFILHFSPNKKYFTFQDFGDILNCLKTLRGSFFVAKADVKTVKALEMTAYF